MILLDACRKKNGIPAPIPVSFTVPPGFPAPKYDFSKNPLTEQGIALGRKIFYDQTLSSDGMVSCGTCHEQSAAFTTYDHPTSHGVNNTHTSRNAPGIFNMAWQTEFMWDGRIKDLDQVPLAHITSPIDMGETIENFLNKIRANEEYRIMFEAAFGTEQINYEKMSKAISQFVLTIVSADTKYDRVKAGKETFTLSEQLGYDIYKQKCSSCHKEPLFTDLTYRNIGMPLDPFVKDFGRKIVTGLSSDSIKFKVPSLRNVYPTYPYGHDGRFYDVFNVFEHYRNEVVNGPTTDPLVKNKIALSNFEIGQLQGFFRTLTDSTMIKDSRFSKPN
jgi:cytochrome c peroxidase